VEAVLIPASVARRIFGKEVAQRYAVIELIVSNKDSKAGLIVQSVFLDYSKWLLSGIPASNPQPLVLEPTQKANQPWQVASLESRLVRGELLDAQQWTARNWTIRSLTAIGSVGAGFAFPFSGDVARGMSAFNGVVVPGAATLWPDGTVNQINRINDLGFQTNKIIPKQASDIVVAFFPIDRFLTPTFRKLFLDNPAGFFAPGELLTDPKISKSIAPILMPMAQSIDSNIHSAGDLPGAMVKAFLENCQPTQTGTYKSGSSANDQAAAAISESQGQQNQSMTNCQLQQLFTQLSLNSVHVVVGGVMSVDVASVPATIYEVDFNSGNTNASIWSTAGKQDGKIVGVYLSGAMPSVVDATGVPIDGISLTAVPESSSDTELAFQMTALQVHSSIHQDIFCGHEAAGHPRVYRWRAAGYKDRQDGGNGDSEHTIPILNASLRLPGGQAGGYH